MQPPSSNPRAEPLRGYISGGWLGCSGPSWKSIRSLDAAPRIIDGSSSWRHVRARLTRGSSTLLGPSDQPAILEVHSMVRSTSRGSGLVLGSIDPLLRLCCEAFRITQGPGTLTRRTPFVFAAQPVTMLVLAVPADIQRSSQRTVLSGPMYRRHRIVPCLMHTAVARG